MAKNNKQNSTAKNNENIANNTAKMEGTTMNNTTENTTAKNNEQTTKKLTDRAERIRNKKRNEKQTAQQNNEQTADSKQTEQSIEQTAQQTADAQQTDLKAKLETLKKPQLIGLITTDKTEQGKLAKLTKNALIECLLVQYAKQNSDNSTEQTADSTAEPEQTADSDKQNDSDKPEKQNDKKPEQTEKPKRNKKQTEKPAMVPGLLGEFNDTMKTTAQQIFTELPEAQITGHIKRNKLVVRMNHKVVFKVAPYRRSTTNNVKVFTNDATVFDAISVDTTTEPDSVGMKYSAQLDLDTFTKFIAMFKTAQTEQNSTAA